MSMTNPISARQNWVESHFFLTTITSSLLDMLDQKKNKDVLQYLRHGVINQTDNERLYNIPTRKAASPYTEEISLTVNVSKCIKHLSKCIKRRERFEERIAKQKMSSQWKSFHSLLFGLPVWQSFVPFFRGKN